MSELKRYSIDSEGLSYSTPDGNWVDVDDAEAEITRLKGEVERKSEAFLAATDEIIAALKRAETAEKEVERLKQENLDVRGVFIAQDFNLKNAIRDVETAEAQLAELRAIRKEQAEELSTLQAKVQELEAEVDIAVGRALKRNFTGMEEQLKEAEARVQELEAQLELYQEAHADELDAAVTQYGRAEIAEAKLADHSALVRELVDIITNPYPDQTGPGLDEDIKISRRVWLTLQNKATRMDRIQRKVNEAGF